MALKDKLMTLEDFKAVRDVDVASNQTQFTAIKADLGDLDELETTDKSSIVAAINEAAQSGGGGGGGSSTLSGLTDTSISGKTDGQVLIYNGDAGKWVNQYIGTDSVSDGAITDDKTSGDYKSLFYDEVNISVGRTSNTDYYIATVPKLDSSNEIIPVTLSYDATLNPLEQSWENGSTISVNGYCSILSGSTHVNAIAICDGEIVNRRSFEGAVPDTYLYLGMKPDRTIVEYLMSSSVTPEDMLADGCTNVFNCYFKLVENGQIVSALEEETIVINGTTITDDMRNPLMLMGVKTNGDIVFLACDGRSIINDGLTYGEAGTILISQGCDTVYNLDGGGSACLAVRGSKLNRNIDDSGTTIRNIHYALNVIKASKNTPTSGAYAKIGAEKQALIKQIVPQITAVYDALPTQTGKAISSNDDLNDYLTEGKYYCASATVARTLVNAPVSVGFSMYMLRQGSTTRVFTQLIIANDSSDVQPIYYRMIVKTTEGAFSSATTWKKVINDTDIASATVNGLMSSTDKQHLDAVYADYSAALTALGA